MCNFSFEIVRCTGHVWPPTLIDLWFTIISHPPQFLLPSSCCADLLHLAIPIRAPPHCRALPTKLRTETPLAVQTQCLLIEITHATIEVHHEGHEPRTWRVTHFTEILVLEENTGVLTERKNIMNWVYSEKRLHQEWESDNFGLRIPIVQKTFQIKKCHWDYLDRSKGRFYYTKLRWIT